MLLKRFVVYRNNLASRGRSRCDGECRSKRAGSVLTFEIKDLNEEHLAAIETIENEHATAIETIENEHKQDVEALESDHAADIASVNEVLESTRQENEQYKQDISAKDTLLAEQKVEIANLRAEVKAMKKVEEMFEKVLQQKNDK